MASSRSLGQLTLDLIMKLGGFKQGADQATRITDTMSKKMKADAAEISGAFKKIGATLGIGFGVQQLVSGLINAGAAAIKFGEDINRAVIITGASAESLSELAYAAKIADIEFGDLSTGITKMQKAISAASGGNKEAIASFAALGLKMSDLKELSADQQLEKIADGLKAIPDDADRAAAAIEIFGKSGASLLPLFEQGAAGIRAARQEADKLNLTMTGAQAKAYDDAGDAITRMKEAWHGFARVLMSEVAPALTEAANQMGDLISGSEEGQKRQAVRILKGLDEQTFTYTTNASGEKQKVTRGTGGLIIGVEGVPNGYYSAEEISDLLKKAEDALKPTTLPGSDARAQALSRGPGAAYDVAKASEQFKAGEAERKAASAAAKAAADEATKAAAERAKAEADALAVLAGQYEDTYKRAADAIEASKTESQKALDVLTAQRVALDNAAAAFPAWAEELMETKKKLEDEFLNEPLIVATKIEIPPPPKTELDEFKQHMADNMQDIVADFLVDPFDKGFDEILGGFAKMIAAMMAQALAADFIKNLMGSAGGGTGSGWLGTFAGLFEHGGFIPPGQFGVVGETGPELVMGGRTGQTVTPMAAAAAPQVNLRNINAFDSDVIRDYLVSAQGEQVMLNFIERNGTRVRTAAAGA